MYTIYHTEAIVLGGADSGEASRYLYLLTESLGLVGAHARALRELSSKLRYGLQDFSHARVDLLHGRGGWRVKSAIPIANCHDTLRNPEWHMNIYPVARIALLLRRLLRGESEHRALYEEVRNGFEAFRTRTLLRDEREALEILLVMRILCHLGYWGEHEALSPLLRGDIEESEFLSLATKEKRIAIREINKALAETHL